MIYYSLLHTCHVINKFVISSFLMKKSVTMAVLRTFTISIVLTLMTLFKYLKTPVMESIIARYSSMKRNIILVHIKAYNTSSKEWLQVDLISLLIYVSCFVRWRHQIRYLVIPVKAYTSTWKLNMSAEVVFLLISQSKLWNYKNLLQPDKILQFVIPEGIVFISKQLSINAIKQISHINVDVNVFSYNIHLYQDWTEASTKLVFNLMILNFCF